ncbi:hypothetical protein MMG00_12165 [Ignatzschineria rhizosphaerae]|uniref:DUF2681 domain-containing protein n=1 Tax=Ignatzschineria rhizosphaerae TaxID=2923279 RepID=A0ABY3X580_9GAMM|nr:hypothetical protein [Ignatzschineria rhizosphaerae]UNM95940.1 hypothetical protein MMG00_12165 [Ignatzschineria rhizosphaerae]
MDKFKNILLAIGGLILAFFYALLKSKDRQIEKHKNEAERNKSKAEKEKFKADAEKDTKHTKDRINSASESDIDGLLNKQNALRDERD